MSRLRQHIDRNNHLFINKIIDAIKDDHDWLIKLGLSEIELNNEKLIPYYIGKYVSNLDNLKTIDLLLKYIIADFIYDDDQIPLIKHTVSADSYSRTSSLFVFKCSNLYFCYFTGDEIRTQITNDPEFFCLDAAKSIKDFHEIERMNLLDNYFNESDVYNELQYNFNFDIL